MPQSPKFDNLPLAGVVVRVALDQELPIDLEFILDLGPKFDREVYSLRDAPTLEVPPGGGNFVLFPPAPRLGGILFSKDDGVTIRIQRDLLSVTWAKSDDYQGLGYDEYEKTLITHLKAAAGHIEDLVGRGGLTSRACNMSYILGPIKDVASMSNPFHLVDVLSSNLLDGNQLSRAEVTVTQPDGIDRRISVGKADDGFVVEAVAGRAYEPTTFDVCYDMLNGLHDTLVTQFVTSLTPEGKSLWQLRQ